MQAVESRRPNQLVFRVQDNKTISFRPQLETPSSSEVVDAVILTLARAVRSIFPGVMLSQVIAKVGLNFNFDIHSSGELHCLRLLWCFTLYV